MLAIISSAIVAADARTLIETSLADVSLRRRLVDSSALDVISVGKAADGMLAGVQAVSLKPLRRVIGIGINSRPVQSSDVEWYRGSHPIPGENSVRAAKRAMEIASLSRPEDHLLVCLSGGASSLMALPNREVSLRDKQQTIRLLLERGADITELNTVRKHLSRIKGGRLSEACAGTVSTLVISDVVGDELSVIGSGPTVSDPTQPGMALEVLEKFGGRESYPKQVVAFLEDKKASDSSESRLSSRILNTKNHTRIVGNGRVVVEGARRAAEDRGYRVNVLPEPIVGEARTVALTYANDLLQVSRGLKAPLCLIASGETTVRVTGAGSGGRNQEFALALALEVKKFDIDVVVASIGTDGIDGPTNAAGAIIDTTTIVRASNAGLKAPSHYLKENNSYEFFSRLGDLIRTGQTETNVGDLHVALIANSSENFESIPHF